MADIENKKAAIKELLDKGKKKGLLTYKEIVEGLEELDLEPEQIEKFYETAEQIGIEVVRDMDEANCLERRGNRYFCAGQYKR